MKNDMTKKVEIITLTLVAIFFFLIIMLFFLRFFSPVKNIGLISQPTPTPVSVNSNPSRSQGSSPADLDTSYSNLNLIVPGKSTTKDVEKINGLPISSSTTGDKAYLYYPTPFKGLFNKILLINNVVVYAQEAVFSNYRGDYNSFTQSFGQPAFTIYNEQSPLDFPWSVFLEHGVAVQSSSNDVTGIIYFVPQEKVSFITNVANDLGLSENVPTGQSDFVNPGL